MKTQVLVLLVLAFTSADAIQRRSQFTRYRSWNSRMYPVWKDGDSRFRNCWFGGEVTFEVKNDAPTLTGARATFSINLNFPPNQTVLSDGQVVWAQNCTINGQQYQQGQPVYQNQDTTKTGLFPDGTPFTRNQDRRPQYVFVWKTWGRYWQVADGPSSSLTIGTDNVPLGSYNMEVVIYHCRGKNNFIPLGYASSNFMVTDQVPFTLSLSQVNDINQDDENFIQNRAIAFSVNVHDPSQYLNEADISFSWDFGDSSGTLISRERTVTHTFLNVGTFKPQVVLMATIPNGCGNPTAGAPLDASAVPMVPVEGGDAVVDGEAVVNTDAVVVEVASVAPAAVDAAVVPEEQDPANTATEEDAAAAAAAATAEDTAATAEEEDAAAAAEETAVTAEEEDAAATAEETAVTAEEAGTAAPAAEEPAAAGEGDAVAEGAVEQEAEAADAAATIDATVEGDETAVVEVPADATVAPAAEGTMEQEAEVEDADAVVTIDAAADVAPAAEGEEAAAAAAEVPEDVTVAPAAEGTVEQEAEIVAAEADATVDAAAEVIQAETEAPADNAVAPVATEATAEEEAAAPDAVADTEAEVQEAENEVAATAAAAEQPAAEGEVQAEVEAEPVQVALVLVKRQAPELSADCTVYRYGSLATSVDVVQGIESVEIVQMSNVVSLMTELEQNAVDVTISCQGSLPSEVCTVISDADCITPVETVCTAAAPSPDCQMVLRQFFNDSGVFCLNVSLTNDVSLAVASARVSVNVASGGSPAGTAAIILGVMVLACIVCCVGLMYRRFKQYQPLTEDQEANGGGNFAVTSVPLLLWNLLSRQSSGESRPLLQGRIV